MHPHPRPLRPMSRAVLGCVAAAALVLALVAVASSASAGLARAGAASRKPLAGKIIGIDPGHNGLNYTDPAFLSRQIWNGRAWENCDTTGTQTAGGYSEARFNWNVTVYLRADLIKAGARVVITRKSNHGLGPCVNTRARILDRARANVSIDIHADSGPASGRGFSILEPIADSTNHKVIRMSLLFGRDVHAAMLRYTRISVSDYYGSNGYVRRSDLAGLNLTTMPKVLIECGNMSNPKDAALLVRSGVQRSIAAALAAAIVRFLTSR
jgi:N-acetylmuramoyl-L-alanine amidase